MTVDELGDYGMVRMTDDEIANFLGNRSTGVLGLPTDGAPYMLPMSFAFDGESTLYFYFVLGGESRKDELVERGGPASFLVYSADTMFTWQSVALTGSIAEVPEQEWSDVRERTEIAWRPALFETASESEAIKLYRFDVETTSGIKHTGLPPGFADRREES